MFQSFFMGGFECATHRRRDGLQIDVISVTGHDLLAAEDYRLLRDAGILTVRDGLRWHMIETADGVYDWSSFLPMLEASLETGTQVIWDLCHWGVPAGVDVFSPDFIRRFEAFARAAAEVVRARTETVPYFCPINEMSFWSWVGGDEAHFAPHASGRGPELKRQLATASIAAIRAIREVDARARFVQPEPIINIAPFSKDKKKDREDARRHTASQFEAWDLVRGEGDLGGFKAGGSPEMLDIIGVNFYWNNQWVHRREKTPMGHPLHVPLHRMLVDLWKRYGRPILITETGVEAGAAVGWLGYICAEVRQAMREGANIQGICLYPVMDYPGWDNDRHCACGLIEVATGWAGRAIREDLRAELMLQQRVLEFANEPARETVGTL